MMNKLGSRKFWLSTAAFLGSLGTGIAGLCVDNPTLTIVGSICAVVSTAIYAAVEGYVDAAHKDNGTDKS